MDFKVSWREALMLGATVALLVAGFQAKALGLWVALALSLPFGLLAALLYKVLMPLFLRRLAQGRGAEPLEDEPEEGQGPRD
ncbi:magnesium transporter [Calidithermus chliarophilus]|uniref:magnesium transporter n=1 Tax=Calidithermus chliarophilus TaxID=52023 RepID=UPI0003F698FA|nr:magnesium transporter [Calidithermus chliarophilus]